MAYSKAAQAAQRRFYLRHADKIKAYAKRYRATHQEQTRERGRRWDQAHRKQRNEQAHLWRQKFPDRAKANSQRSFLKLKSEIRKAYGERCVCCGETEPKFLALDHVDGNGASHRRSVGRGTRFFSWVKRNGFPLTLQLLCHNCNCAKAFYGVCPHQEST